MRTFYDVLNYLTKALVDLACGGSIITKATREANKLFEELAKKNLSSTFGDKCLKKTRWYFGDVREVL